MNDSQTPHIDAAGNPIPVYSIQTRLANFGAIGAVGMFMCTVFFSDVTVSVAVNGDSTVYTASSILGYLFYVVPVLTGLATIVFALQPGIYRLFAVALALITAWAAHGAVTLDTSNHNVTVTSTSVSREVGTTSDPIRREIDFTKTAYLYIDEVPGSRGPEYELVAHAADDGAETRVPIFDMMRAALPQIIETAIRHEVVLGEAVDGSIIPAALEVDDDE